MANKKEYKQQGEFNSIKLYEAIGTDRQKILDIYKNNRAAARIIFEQVKNYGGTGYKSIYSYEYKNGDFRIVSFNKNISFAKNNVLYRREKVDYTIIYRKITKSFYLIINNKFIPCTVGNLYGLLENGSGKVIEYMVGKFGWLRNAHECEEGKYLTLSTINRHKLFNREKIIKHVYGVNHDIAKKISKVVEENNSFKFLWKRYKHLFYNLEKGTPEFFKNTYLSDTCKFSEYFGEKINCAWGNKRIKQVHDALSKRMVAVILEHEPLKQLNVKDVYLDFAKFSGYKVLLTNHELIEEGKKQSHCVGTYSSEVNSGVCAIFHIDDYTLDLRFNANGYWCPETAKWVSEKIPTLKVNQFRGFDNVDAPFEKMGKIKVKIEEYNDLLKSGKKVFGVNSKENSVSFFDDIVDLFL